MFPISKRAQATILAAVVLAVTLFAVPAQAVSPRALQAQDAPTWSLLSWSFWQDALSPVLGWFQSDDHETTVQQAEGPRSLSERLAGALEPNGAPLTALSPDGSLRLEDGSN